MPSLLRNEEPKELSEVLSTSPSKWVGVEEAAEFLSVKPSWLYNSGDRYGVPCSKLGNGRRYNLEQLDTFMRENTAA